ncbi:DUF1289 domain-containing protein [Vibrio sp. WJH972]
MEQLDFFDVKSPCIRVCTVDDKGYCIGCMRNRKERFGWLSMSTAEKLHVIKLCRLRYYRKKARPKIDESAIDEVSPQKDLFS